MKYKLTAESTANRSVYKKAHKNELANKGEIKCSYCKYHKNENSKGIKKFISKPKKKDYR